MPLPLLHVLTHKDDFNNQPLNHKIVVVLDILFATTTIVHAIEKGASHIFPALHEADARHLATHTPPEHTLLAGEKNAVQLEGFAPFTPLALGAHTLQNKRIIYATTNGTVALRVAAAQGAYVYAAALRNGAAIAQHLHRHHTEATIMLMCAGSAGSFNLEDFYGAGYIVHEMNQLATQHWQLSDAAIAACQLYRSWQPQTALRTGRVGKLVCQLGFEAELDFSAQLGVSHIIPALRDGHLVNVAT